MKSNIFYDKEFWPNLAERLTKIWTASGRLPYHYDGRDYNKISCMYQQYLAPNAGSLFTAFYYTNDWKNYPYENVENAYGLWYGPSIDVKEALPDLWAELSDLTRIQIMSDVLGSHG